MPSHACDTTPVAVTYSERIKRMPLAAPTVDPPQATLWDRPGVSSATYIVLPEGSVLITAVISGTAPAVETIAQVRQQVRRHFPNAVPDGFDYDPYAPALYLDFTSAA